ncbi:uncharacterized protein LOC110629514 isoform X2 [Manihot esculenta]|uniref:uncharacterized protein LOC110629514 isoform X2 n=1 Tax=Manihot esculenta TaxID=3983 RepID=UPI001CC4A398|nr:uncharacterized protein LOC110629514 isoform X2 [Manihot esculenta]
MDPRHTGEILKHLEKQNELLMEAYNSMSHELHKLQVEEEMLMRKFYELMTAQGLTKKNFFNVIAFGRMKKIPMFRMGIKSETILFYLLIIQAAILMVVRVSNHLQ